MFDPKNTLRDSRLDTRASSASLGRNAHPWAWIVGLIVALLLAWGFFGMDHLKVDTAPDTAPAAIEATAD
jgi:hypothetical protein